VTKSAIISDCGFYRYLLTRVWDVDVPTVNFVMLNPSTADASEDDPTIRRCLGYAKSWDMGGLVVTNLFAFRATDPSELNHVADPIGKLNDAHLEAAAIGSSLVIRAWGNHGKLWSRGEIVHRMLMQIRRTHHLGLTRTGEPKHPLYLRNDLTPIPDLPAYVGMP
jgi:hypothetical protein